MSNLIFDHSITHSPIDVSEEKMKLWQDLVDLMAETLKVPAGLIMRINDEDIEVFIASRNQENPYHPGEKEVLHESGLYCERVLKTRDLLIVPNALEDEEWKDNPDVKLGMIFYAGYPIKAPDGKLFGTICILDKKKTEPSKTYQRLMMKFRDMIEMDLLILARNQDLNETCSELERKSAEYKRVETQLRLNSVFLDRIIESSAVSTWISDEKGTAIRANPACLAFFGAREEEIIGKYNLFRDDVIKREGFMPTIRRVFEAGEPAEIIIDYDFAAVDHVQVEHATHKIVTSIFTPIIDDQKRVTNVIIQTIDLTDLKRTERALNERIKELNCLYRISELMGKPDVSMREILQKTVDIIPRSWQYLDDTCARILYEGEEFRAHNFKQTKRKMTADIVAHKSKLGVIEVYYLMETAPSCEGCFLKEERVLLNAIAERLGRSIEYQHAQDELKKKTAQLEQLATHDFLTGLPNRVLFYDRFAQAILLSKRKQNRIAVCIADIDDFKEMNDNFGHPNGDKVLKEVALRSKSALREYDTIARMGGDEFSILILSVKKKNELEKILKRMMKKVNQKFDISSHIIMPSLSIGIAIYPDDGTNIEELINKADKAMYESKGKGKNRYCFFKSESK